MVQIGCGILFSLAWRRAVGLPYRLRLISPSTRKPSLILKWLTRSREWEQTHTQIYSEHLFCHRIPRACASAQQRTACRQAVFQCTACRQAVPCTARHHALYHALYCEWTPALTWRACSLSDCPACSAASAISSFSYLLWYNLCALTVCISVLTLKSKAPSQGPYKKKSDWIWWSGGSLHGLANKIVWNSSSQQMNWPFANAWMTTNRQTRLSNSQYSYEMIAKTQ